MRKRWNTIFKNNKDVNHRIIDKMFAHQGKDFPLDETYHLPTIEKSEVSFFSYILMVTCTI